MEAVDCSLFGASSPYYCCRHSTEMRTSLRLRKLSRKNICIFSCQATQNCHSLVVDWHIHIVHEYACTHYISRSIFTRGVRISGPVWIWIKFKVPLDLKQNSESPGAYTDIYKLFLIVSKELLVHPYNMSIFAIPTLAQLPLGMYV